MVTPLSSRGFKKNPLLKTDSYSSLRFATKCLSRTHPDPRFYPSAVRSSDIVTQMLPQQPYLPPPASQSSMIVGQDNLLASNMLDNDQVIIPLHDYGC